MEKRHIFIIGIIIILIISGIIFTRLGVQAAPEQPIFYSHNAHTTVGVQCLYCHSEATRSEIAGIPSMEKCIGCHNFIANEIETVQIVIDYWDRGEAIPWQRVNDQPDFVYFSHQPHILFGLNCETCHGDVSSMDSVKPVLRMDMGWCIDCHREQDDEKVPRLVDCLACHK